MHSDQETIFTRGNVFARDDTFFGVCEAIGQDLGFNPIWLRLALAATLFFNPLAAIAAYAAAGLLMALLRWAVPNPRAAKCVEAEAAPTASCNDEAEPFAAAA
jgi:phage shock protein C